MTCSPNNKPLNSHPLTLNPNNILMPQRSCLLCQSKELHLFFGCITDEYFGGVLLGCYVLYVVADIAFVPNVGVAGGEAVLFGGDELASGGRAH